MTGSSSLTLMSPYRDFDVLDPVISDHYVVSCSLVLPKRAFQRKEVNYRKLKPIDLQELRDDISDSPLISTVDEAGHDLESLLTLYNTTLIGLLDKHAPLKTRTITIRPSAPWYNEDIREEKQKRRALERRWRRTGLTIERRQRRPIIRGLLTRTNMIPNRIPR